MVRRIKKFLIDFFRYLPITAGVRNSIKLLQNANKDKQFEVKLIGKNNVRLRGKSTDLSVLESTFIHKHHRSPFHLGDKPVIVDLGSNIGLTLLDYSYEYPGATLFGVELDSNNFELLKKNTQSLNNCKIINAGIWKINGMVSYGGADAQSFSIDDVEAAQTNQARAITIGTLFNEHGIFQVEYLKMDIEGAEKAIFLESEDLDWLKKVKIISIEVHAATNDQIEEVNKKISQCLQKNGFVVHKSALHWSSLIACKKEYSY